VIDATSSQGADVSPESHAAVPGRVFPPRPVVRDTVPGPKAEKSRSIGAAIGGDRRVEVILAVMKGDLTVVEGARQAGVSENTFNRDRAIFIDAGRNALAKLGKGSQDSGMLVCSDMKIHALGAAALERYTDQVSSGHVEGA